LGLSYIHFFVLHLFFCNLLPQESLRLSIYIFYFLLDSLVLLFPQIPLLLPHDGLFVEVGFVVRLPSPLLFFLLRQRGLHFLFISQSLPCLLFFIAALFHFTIALILCYDFFFAPLRLIHILKHTIRHPIHELLCPPFPRSDFIQAVLFLLVEHCGVGLLHINIFLSGLFSLLPLQLIIPLILLKHSVIVFALLPLLLHRNFPFMIHLSLQSLDSCHLVLQALPRLLLLLLSLSSQLLISCFLLVGHFVSNLLVLFIFALIYQIKVSHEHLVIRLRLLLHLALLLVLFRLLLMKLLLHQPGALPLTLGSLLLLLVMEQSVKLLDSSPLVGLFDGHRGGYDTGCHRLLIVLSIGAL